MHSLMTSLQAIANINIIQFLDFKSSSDVFPETGEYLNQLRRGLTGPHGIAIHENSLFVSSIWRISKYSLTDFSLVKQIGGKGSNNGEFKYPTQLTTDPNGHVHIADCNNSRICVLDTDLYHMRNITIGAKYSGAGGASAPPALSDRSAGGARWCKDVQGGARMCKDVQGGARMCNRCIEVHHWHFWLQVKGLRL